MRCADVQNSQREEKEDENKEGKRRRKKDGRRWKKERICRSRRKQASYSLGIALRLCFICALLRLTVQCCWASTLPSGLLSSLLCFHHSLPHLDLLCEVWPSTSPSETTLYLQIRSILLSAHSLHPSIPINHTLYPHPHLIHISPVPLLPSIAVACYSSVATARMHRDKTPEAEMHNWYK